MISIIKRTFPAIQETNMFRLSAILVIFCLSVQNVQALSSEDEKKMINRSAFLAIAHHFCDEYKVDIQGMGILLDINKIDVSEGKHAQLFNSAMTLAQQSMRDAGLNKYCAGM